MADQIIISFNQLDQLAQQLNKLSSSMSDVEAKIRALRISEEGGATLQVRLPGAPLRSVPYNLSSGDVNECLRSLARGLDQLKLRAQRTAGAVQYTREGFERVERSVAQLFTSEMPEDWRNNGALSVGQSVTISESQPTAGVAETPTRSKGEEARTPGTELNDLYREIFELKTSLYVMTQKEIINEYTQSKKWLPFVEAGYNVLRPTDWQQLNEDVKKATVLNYLNLNGETDSKRQEYTSVLIAYFSKPSAQKDVLLVINEVYKNMYGEGFSKGTTMSVKGIALIGNYIKSINDINSATEAQKALYAYAAADAAANIQKLQELKEKMPEYGAICDDMITKVDEAAHQQFNTIMAASDEECKGALWELGKGATDLAAREALKFIGGEAVSSGLGVTGAIKMGIKFGNVIGDALGAGECINSRQALVKRAENESDLRTRMFQAYYSDPSPERDAELKMYTKMYLASVQEGTKTAQGISKNDASSFAEENAQVNAMIQRLDELWAKQ